MFDGFTQTHIQTSGARINLRYGGSGPPLLLLHGNPLTHAMWHKIAPRLAHDFTVTARNRTAAPITPGTRFARWRRTRSR